MICRCGQHVPLHQSRVGILNKKSLWISAITALAAAVVLAGCGSTSYFDGRTLPPSGLVNRVIIAIQNPGILAKGAIEIVDAYYDERSGYNGKPASFSIAGYGGALPTTIQNLPEEQFGAVYGSGDGSLTLADYANERTSGTVSGLPGPSSSVFITRNREWVFAASQAVHQFTVVNQGAGASIGFGLPNVYRVSVNPGGSVALAFVQNSPYVYYPIQLTEGESTLFAGGPSRWPQAAVDCEPQSVPIWCLLQMQSPDHLDQTYNGQNGLPLFYTGAPLTFDHPVKALFSADGSTAYILSCGPECGGTNAAYTPVPIAPMIFLQGQYSGLLPTTAALAHATVAIPGGASNALVDGSTMYVVGQSKQTVSGQSLFGGNLSVINLASNSVTSTTAISDGTPGAMTRMVEADDNTLWIAMTGCTTGVRYATNPASGYGCLTMYNTSTNKVTLIEPYIGDATGVTAVTGLHKVYTAEGGQVYIYSTVDGSSINNQFVTVTGVAYDVAYIDAITDTDNTVY